LNDFCCDESCMIVCGRIKAFFKPGCTVGMALPADLTKPLLPANVDDRSDYNHLLTKVDDRSAHNPPKTTFKEAFFVNKRGLRIRVYFALPTKTQLRGIVIPTHGIRAHALYEVLCSETPGGRRTCLQGSFAELFLDEGYAIYTMDFEGHGMSGNQRAPHIGYFHNVGDLVDDMVLLATLVRNEHPDPYLPLPIYATGSSLGGGVCIGACIKKPKLFQGLILMAPMVSVERVANKGLNKVMVRFGPTVVKVCPCVESKRLVSFPKSADEILAKCFDEDPLTDSAPKMLAGPALASLVYCLDLQTKIEDLVTPFLTIHAKEDTSTDPKSSEVLMSLAKSPDKTYRDDPPPGSNHNLINSQVSHDWLFETIRQWMRERQ